MFSTENKNIMWFFFLIHESQHIWSCGMINNLLLLLYNTMIKHGTEWVYDYIYSI